MIALVFAAALMAAAPAAGEQAAQPAGQAAAPAKAAKPDKSDLVCKKEAVVGSRMKTRMCLSQAEWDARAVQAKEDLDNAQRNQPMRAQ